MKYVKKKKKRAKSSIKICQNKIKSLLLFFTEINSTVVELGFTTLLTSQVISVAFYSEREKLDKFNTDALISA